MYQLFYGNGREARFNDPDEAVLYGKLLRKFGIDIWLVNDVWEYNFLTDQWSNMAY